MEHDGHDPCGSGRYLCEEGLVVDKNGNVVGGRNANGRECGYSEREAADELKKRALRTPPPASLFKFQCPPTRKETPARPTTNRETRSKPTPGDRSPTATSTTTANPNLGRSSREASPPISRTSGVNRVAIHRGGLSSRCHEVYGSCVGGRAAAYQPARVLRTGSPLLTLGVGCATGVSGGIVGVDIGEGVRRSTP